MEDSKRRLWNAAQLALLAVGVGLVAALIWLPSVGIDLFWNFLIPVAPALLVVAPGIWRNICPMATASLLPRRLGLSRRRKLPPKWRGRLAVLGVVTLVLLVPMRHLAFNASGLATAAMLVGAAVVAMAMGSVFEWRSGWCASLCPIHPVEKLYGGNPALVVANARCASCTRCVGPCADSTPGMSPSIAGKRGPERILGHLVIGGFVGYVWGWYQVPDSAVVGFAEVARAYLVPLLSAAVSAIAYVGVKRVLPEAHHKRLERVFATAAVVAYYWYRLPALVGFGLYPGDGMLVDLSSTLPSASVWVMQSVTTAFFCWYLLLRAEGGRSWAIRPTLAR